MSRIKSLRALEILDSRGVPTLRVFVQTDKGVVGIASVPSGASTGEHEAHELRDLDAKRYGGKGVLKALENVTGPLAKALVGLDVLDQLALDQKMKELDGTPNKSKLGANAILGVSMALAKAAAQTQQIPLYKHLYQLMPGSHSPCEQWQLPCPMLNIINGGAHADNSIDAQEFMIRPVGAPSFSEGLRWSCEIYSQLKKILKNRKLSTGVGDEGGFAPLLERDEQALELILEAIRLAGFTPGSDVTLALDAAASEFFEKGVYSDKKKLARGMSGTRRSSMEQVALLQQWVSAYPIDSIEDGLAENDWEGFVALSERLGASCQIVGDDLLVTNPEFVRRAIKSKAVNAVLIKLNQIGTVSETLETIDLAHRAGLKTVISHRSGETEDTFIADLAVGTHSGQIKTGAPCRSERIAKYNRLLEIEAELGSQAIFVAKA